MERVEAQRFGSVLQLETSLVGLGSSSEQWEGGATSFEGDRELLQGEVAI